MHAADRKKRHIAPFYGQLMLVLSVNRDFMAMSTETEK